MAVSAKAKAEIMAKTIKEIQKAMPDDIVGKYNEIGDRVDIKTISTGSLAVDFAIGGGFARNKVIDIVGHTSSGKTTLALTAIAKLQKEEENANVMYIDAEQALDPSYAEALGVNMDNIILMQPSSGENAFNAAEMFINSGVADLLVIDSIAAMLPKAMIERSYDQEAQPGIFAKFITTGVARLTRAANQRGCTVILINQWKPVVRMQQYQAVPGAIGNWYQPGGAQLPFYCSQIIEVKKSGEIKSGKEVVSSIVTVTCKKNKIAPPYRSADFVITYGKGIDKSQELVGLGVSLGVIKMPGRGVFSCPELTDKTFRGRQALAAAIEQDNDFADSLEKAIKAQMDGKKSLKIAGVEKSEDSEFAADDEGDSESFVDNAEDQFEE